MKKIDFISGAPKTFIFQQDSNKTNLGAILTVLFIIAILLIMTSYIYEYFANDKYVVSYFYNEVFYDENEKTEIYNNKDLYPDLSYELYLEHLGGNKDLLEDIIILDSFNNNPKEIPLGEKITTSISDLFFVLLYKCKTVNNVIDCSLRVNKSEINFNFFALDIYYDGYFCDHQNPDSPIRRQENYYIFPFIIGDIIDYYLFDWKIIKYEEENSFSGMLRSTKETYGGMITRKEKVSFPSEGLPFYGKRNEETGDIEHYKIVAIMQYYKDNFGYYDNYSRERISIFDAIANICALVSTLYGVVTFIFCGFYSNSFDNYKIVEKIISRSSYLNIKDIKDIKDMKDEPPKEHKELTDQIGTDKGETLLEVKEDKDDKRMIGNGLKQEKDVNSKPLFKIPKFHFYDFLYNNIYFDCCKPSSTQGIISHCNDLISKYNSIDSIVYNQIRLDNLFKDYKWNNPQLNTVGNNDLIYQIKTLSENLTGS